MHVLILFCSWCRCHGHSQGMGVTWQSWTRFQQNSYQHHGFLLRQLRQSTQRMDESVLLDLLECPVCLERLDASAKVLPCQHTFCRRCLQGILGSRGELRCPECRTLVECAVDELPSNILLVRLLDGIKQRPRRAGPGAAVCTNGTPGAVARAHAAGPRDQGAPGAQPQRAQAKSTLVRVSILSEWIWISEHEPVFPIVRVNVKQNRENLRGLKAACCITGFLIFAAD